MKNNMMKMSAIFIASLEFASDTEISCIAFVLLSTNIKFVYILPNTVRSEGEHRDEGTIAYCDRGP